MTEFVPLASTLEGSFDKLLDQLPGELRARVERDLSPLPWDDLSIQQRRIAAEQWDYQHDPATEAERALDFQLIAEKLEIERQIREVELLAAQTPVERESKTRQLEELRGRLETVKARQNYPRAGGVRKPPLPNTSGSSRDSPYEERDDESPDTYIHFLKARDFLKERWGATAEEVGIWVWMGPKAGGLKGYRDTPQYDFPPRFFFSPYDGSPDYVSELMHCYFKRANLEGFVPADRYLTYGQLVDRWRAHLSEHEIIALIKAKGATGELSGFHPITGGVQEAGMWRDQEDFPSIEEGMFCLAHIEKVEAECFRSAAPGSHAEAAIDVATAVKSKSSSVASGKIIAVFPVCQNNRENYRWWNVRMRDANDYDLVNCRALRGRASRPSYWHPDLVAAWLVDKKHKEAKEVAEILRKHFPDCAEAAEFLYPSST